MAVLARTYLLVVVAAVLGCGTGDNPAGKPAAEPPASPAAMPLAQPAPGATPRPAPAEPQLADAGPSSDAGAASDTGAAEHPGAPLGGLHPDGSDSSHRPPRSSARGRARPKIHIVLKSTPSGAIAAVDDVIVGRTPAFWEGELTGQPREFTFVLPGHAMARYRFVPTASGVVHGQLERLKLEPPADGGVSAIVPPEP